MHSNDEFDLVDDAWRLIGRIWNLRDHYLIESLKYMHDMNVIQESEPVNHPKKEVSRVDGFSMFGRKPQEHARPCLGDGSEL